MPLISFQQSLPQPLYSATQVLTVEKQVLQRLGLPMYELMCRAGQAVFDYINTNFSIEASILVVCGKGNNGGDGFVVARLAIERGYTVKVLCLTDPETLTGDAKTAYQALLACDALAVFGSSDLTVITAEISAFKGQLIVDAMFGIGFKGALSQSWLHVVQSINKHSAKVISIDIPSGLNASTGHVESTAVHASTTITFIVFKQGLTTGQAPAYVGELFCDELGVSQEFHDQCKTFYVAQGRTSIASLIPRKATQHKGNIGLALAIGGNEFMPGAIGIAAEAALRAGAALVAICCHASNRNILSSRRLEFMLVPDMVDDFKQSTQMNKARVIMIGPGLGTNTWAKQLFDCALAQNKPLVIDADALVLLSEKPEQRNNWILTPHPGEAAQLLNTTVASIENDRFSAVKTIAKQYGGICVLKGAGSLISNGECVWVNQTGNSGMATGGIGDALSGIIAAFVLQSTSLLDAARLAVSVHGQAADVVAKQYGQRALLVSDLFEPLRQLVNRY